MKHTGSYLAVFALEQIGVKYTFGIPGVHNVELYDALGKSEKILPILTTHEMGAAFMADSISRTTDSIGTLMTVPAAGTTHAMSGIGEAYLDGIAMLIVSGGIRRDSGRHFQLHEIDQVKLVAGICKGAFVASDHNSIIPTIYEAYDLANSGTPGPVLVEIPADLQMFEGQVTDLPKYIRKTQVQSSNTENIKEAIEFLKSFEKPGLYVGWGARHATENLKELAEILGAPVSTTMQGLSVFPADHPLHTGMGFGGFAVPAAEKAFKDCDGLLAIGCRFGELATGSYSLPVPENLIHVDINPDVFNKNYKAKITLLGDAKKIVSELLSEVKKSNHKSKRDVKTLKEMIAIEKKNYFAEWTQKKSDSKVSPGFFFKALREKLDRNAFVFVDDGHHTFLSAELFPNYESMHFASPTDFNAMGYCVPATIAGKLSHPDKQVVGIVGDGAFLMTGIEALTATTHNIGAIFFVFYDGELGQISQFQSIPLNRKTCTILGDIKLEGMATATGAAYFKMSNDEEIDKILSQAFQVSTQGRPVIVDVKIDYSKKTRFTKGVVKSNLSRFALGEKFRFIGRAVVRHIFG